MATTNERTRSTSDLASPWWWVVAVLLVVVVAVAMRVGTGIADRPTRWDERFIRMPIDDLIREGWSVRTAIDFVETKGPGFIWPYAILGRPLGGSLGALRLVSVFLLVLGVVPLLAIAARCGVRGPPLVAVAGLYLLLPQLAVLGQLLMSEAIFVTGTLVLAWTAIVGLSADAANGRSDRLARWAPVLFGILLFVLLHMRVHAVASAGAICLVALIRLGPASWPWFVAAMVAGLGRIPLWWRWGGLVSPEYQYMHQLGGEGGGLFGLLQPSNAVYLVAAGIPFVTVLAIAVWWPGAAASLARRRAVLIGAAASAFAALVFAPRMGDLLDLPPVIAEFAPAGTLRRYVGLVATIARLTDVVAGQTAIVALLAACGGAGLGALWVGPSTLRSGRRAGDDAPDAESDALTLVEAITFWTLVGGAALYMLADAFVFDRYVMPWAALLPIVWWRRLPWPLRGVLALVLLAMLVGWTRVWLLR